MSALALKNSSTWAIVVGLDAFMLIILGMINPPADKPKTLLQAHFWLEIQCPSRLISRRKGCPLPGHHQCDVDFQLGGTPGQWPCDQLQGCRDGAAGFIEAEKSFKKLRGYADLRILITAYVPQPNNSKRLYSKKKFTDSNLQLSSGHRQAAGQRPDIHR